ncbi:multiple RNA-binding domain-containing protein 1 [Marchantia polymorpha subsp. ruderalis]|uniref:RRM domain-containing protein n=1 Tax=Marchantia polymorpha TaxID=3197 RepID=A0A2R6X8G5_MARPO|nr:hypothetical protein MARPO_0030s0107 [Marchantia polymorpha]BBN20258.1 hypothetical protein Mp_8g17720 [Marchantia polymorpha subsp. ruderalis]|eukprot:PTQ42379.1 hypothetical protein MARPO_0030s0107 [Marchantia polymorpha]
MSTPSRNLVSTRICVKNIPRHVNEDRLREHFAENGEVTDARIIRTSDGRSRQFGFVGYRTEEEAVNAVKYFNRSFFDTSRLVCELAQAVGASNLPRPWSRHSEGSSAFDNSHRKKDVESFEVKDVAPRAKKTQTPKTGIQEEENDVQLQEFLQVMQPRSKTKIWANDAEGDDKSLKSGPGGGKSNKKPAVEVRTVEGFARRVPINKGKTSTKLTQVHVRFEDEDDSGSEEDDDQMIDVALPVDPISEKMEVEEDEKDDIVKNEKVSDTDYLKSKVKENWSDSEEEEDQPVTQALPELKEEEELQEEEEEEEEEDEEDDEEEETEKGKSVEGSNVEGVVVSGDNVDDGSAPTLQVDGEEQESVSETGRLFVRNLPYTASEEDLTQIFSKYGQLSQVHLVLDKATKRSKGFAYILYMLPEDAVRAFEALDKSIFQGRLLHLIPAKRPPPAPEPKLIGSGPGSTKYKQEREAQRKAAEAGGDTRAWNMLFMRPDTVAENVAQKYGMTKSEFLDPEAGDLAVRMALGETHIITETKRALSDEGVNVEVLEQVASGQEGKVKRSNHVILVKNLPFTTTEDDLLRMFSAHGSIGRVILPPTKTLAVVEYLEAAEASRAFKSLAYKRFQHVPLYLEWAPEQLLKEHVPVGPQRGSVQEKAVGKDLVKRVEISQKLIGVQDELDNSAAQGGSVFVKNLNFATTQESLTKHFRQLLKQGALRSVKICTKPNKKGGKALSMGFGFVEFDSVETATEVCKNFQGTVLDSHALILQLSNTTNRGKTDSSEKKGSKQGAKDESFTKIIVRNVAFEATRKDLQQLFSPFGQLKSLRLPKKFDGNHRGFAFVEFVTRQEAQNAFDGLKNTHLYGRHMVLERAKNGESLDELRARTSQQFFEDNGVDTRPRKSRLDDDMETSDRPQKKQKSFSTFGDDSE